MVSYKDNDRRVYPTSTKSHDKQSKITTNDLSSPIQRRTNQRSPRNLDTLRESFIDANLDELINLHESLFDNYGMFGFLNKSVSSTFIHAIVDSLVINNSIVFKEVQSNGVLSDDEGY